MLIAVIRAHARERERERGGEGRVACAARSRYSRRIPPIRYMYLYVSPKPEPEFFIQPAGESGDRTCILHEAGVVLGPALGCTGLRWPNIEIGTQRADRTKRHGDIYNLPRRGLRISL
jgi:hypothetical protein